MSTESKAPEVCPVPSHAPIGPDGKPLRMCCVCKDTKVIRDQCVLQKGEEKCTQEINAHKVRLDCLAQQSTLIWCNQLISHSSSFTQECLRSLGFKV